ncbi:hypothetical protein Nepgr_010680 [Nepenthes gracilis]|uniref:Uncharacterized protein n=1 Tax=Nepenthes gracilis TaxID=150966 RepID=A0AAD3SCS4_NEPGR|nr:hypothetical protein Nepgr_010680 [Nepenthes gracilis]
MKKITLIPKSETKFLSEATIEGNEAWSDDTNLFKLQLKTLEIFHRMRKESMDLVGGLEPDNIPLKEQASFDLCGRTSAL